MPIANSVRLPGASSLQIGASSFGASSVPDGNNAVAALLHT